jgi:signal transduction histidine kinase
LATSSPFDAALGDVLDGLHAATLELLRAEDPAEVAWRAAEGVLGLTGSSSAVVALGSPDRGYDRLFTRSAESSTGSLDDGTAIELLAAAGFGPPAKPPDRGWNAAAGAELRAYGQLVGAIAVGRRADYGATERLALDLYAAYVGLAIAASSRWDEPARSVERVEQAHEQAVEVLDSVSSHAATGENLSDFHRRLARTVGELVGAGRVLFWRLGPDHTLEPISGGFRVDAEFLARLKPARCEPGADDLASRVVFDDYIFRASRTDDPPQHAYVLDILGVESAISVPWRAGEERLGLLAAYDSARPGGFSREDAWVLQKAGLAAGLVTRLWQAQEELGNTVDRLTKVDSARQMLLKNLTTVVEKERKRFVSELHDDALQKLTAAELQLARLEPGAALDPELLENLRGGLEETENALRRLVFNVRPPALESPDGLAQSIHDRVAMLAGTRIEAELTLEAPDDLSLDMKTLIFRQVAEAISNVERHSGATHVKISLSIVDGGVLGTVRDDGEGFEVAERSNLPGHLGLLALRERALMAGGRYKIESAPGAGTRVEFWVPLDGA